MDTDKLPAQPTVVIGKGKLLPPPDGCCRICARAHAPEMPHDAQSVFYQMRFKMRYKREGTWLDAISHCAEYVQFPWKRALQRGGHWTEPPAGVEPIAERIDG